jgi:hypothetical protein
VLHDPEFGESPEQENHGAGLAGGIGRCRIETGWKWMEGEKTLPLGTELRGSHDADRHARQGRRKERNIYEEGE